MMNSLNTSRTNIFTFKTIIFKKSRKIFSSNFKQYFYDLFFQNTENYISVLRYHHASHFHVDTSDCS